MMRSQKQAASFYASDFWSVLFCLRDFSSAAGRGPGQGKKTQIFQEDWRPKWLLGYGPEISSCA